MSDLDKLMPLIVSAWAGDVEAQTQLEPLPMWLNVTAPVDQLTGEARAKWQELSAEIGYICSEWNNLEHFLDLLFSCTLKVNTSVAQVIFATLTSNKVRRDLLLNVARLVLLSDAHLKSIERLSKRIGKAASKRNFLVHGIASMNTKNPGYITINGKSADMDPAISHYESWTLPALQEFRKEMHQITLDIQALSFVINRARRRPLHEIRAKSPDQPWEIGNNRRPVRPAKPKAPPPPFQGLPSRGKPPNEKPSSAQRRERALARGAELRAKKGDVP